jgi:hypothetical protein
VLEHSPGQFLPAIASLGSNRVVLVSEQAVCGLPNVGFEGGPAHKTLPALLYEGLWALPLDLLTEEHEAAALLARLLLLQAAFRFRQQMQGQGRASDLQPLLARLLAPSPDPLNSPSSSHRRLREEVTERSNHLPQKRLLNLITSFFREQVSSPEHAPEVDVLIDFCLYEL